MSASEMTDQTWNGLIKIAVKYQNRLGKFHNVRYDRLVVFTVKNMRLYWSKKV